MGTAEKKRRVRKVPDYLVKETIEGQPVYYKGYRDVLNGKKTKEDIMADGLLQWILKSWLTRLLIKGLEEKRYWIGTGEIGSHISHKTNTSHDLAVFEKSNLTPDQIGNRYASVPACLVVEVDTEVEFADYPGIDVYVQLKTQKTLDFGTQRVIWIFTSTRKILIAERHQDWIICDWDKTVELLDGVVFCVAEFLESEGIRLDVAE